jgi:hypothetical protein
MLAVVVMFIKQFTLLLVESCLGELRAAVVIGKLRGGVLRIFSRPARRGVA